MNVDEVKALEGTLTPCLNPSHKATIDAMHARFGIEVAIPETPPHVALGAGDSVIVIGVRGLPRLTDRHEYTEEEIAAATFNFAMYTVCWLALFKWAAQAVAVNSEVACDKCQTK